jgi:hypothetical protein
MDRFQSGDIIQNQGGYPMGKNQRLSGKPIQGEIEKSLRLDIIKDGNLQLKEGIKSFSFEYLGLKNNWDIQDLIHLLSIGIYRGIYWGKYQSQLRKEMEIRDKIREEILEEKISEEKKKEIDEEYERRIQNL